mmetsp:Transcript_27110/g.47907  ORF Transcript_27110/g.47907 Transcript_27110/m.47907 type:complete len:238 (-) Transcript_27110:95-808(-)
MREYDPDSEELLTSFKEWADSNFGSVRHCFKALDSDRSGSVTYPELKRACHKMKWLGNVRMLFDCLDLDSGDRRNRDVATGKRAISLEEISFLDTWHVEPRPELAKFEDGLAELEARRVLSRDQRIETKLLRKDSRKGKNLASRGGSRPKTGPAGQLSHTASLPKCEGVKRVSTAPPLQRPQSQGDLRNSNKRHDSSAQADSFQRHRPRSETVECRPQTDNSWLQAFTSFHAVGVHR